MAIMNLLCFVSRIKFCLYNMPPQVILKVVFGLLMAMEKIESAYLQQRTDNLLGMEFTLTEEIGICIFLYMSLKMQTIFTKRKLLIRWMSQLEKSIGYLIILITDFIRQIEIVLSYIETKIKAKKKQESITISIQVIPMRRSYKNLLFMNMI